MARKQEFYNKQQYFTRRFSIKKRNELGNNTLGANGLEHPEMMNKYKELLKINEKLTQLNQFHNLKPLILLSFLTTKKGVPPQHLEIIVVQNQTPR